MIKKMDTLSQFIGEAATLSLKEEVLLTPKPGLVDQQDTGSHKDLTLELMLNSANSLTSTFKDIAEISYGAAPTQYIRESIAKIGRQGEKKMYQSTNNINSHKGAIWALGLVASAFAIEAGNATSFDILQTAGKIAQFPDRKHVQISQTNGLKVISKYNVAGAREEAVSGFPTIRKFGLPAYNYYKTIGYDSETTQIMTLMTLIANLDDTCILHRSGMRGLKIAKKKANKIIDTKDLSMLKEMNEIFIKLNISPGGSADMLATILFLDKLNNYKR